MHYKLSPHDLLEILKTTDQNIVISEKFKFRRLSSWRKEVVPDYPGIYILYEKIEQGFDLLYIGETGNLRERMSDVCKTVNHTFRRQLAAKLFNGIKTKSKFDDQIEASLNIFFDDRLYASFLEVNFGRTEIEEYLVTKYQKKLLNSEKKRKLKIELDSLEDKTN